MHTLTITLFTDGSLAAGNTDRRLPPRAEALLLILLLSPGDQLERSWIRALLWPQLPAERGDILLGRLRTQIEQQLAALQPDRPALVSSSRGWLQINRSGLSVDLLEFEAVYAAVEHHHHLEVSRCPHCLSRLEEALAKLPAAPLYRPQPRQPDAFQRWYQQRISVTLLQLQSAYRSVIDARLQQQPEVAAALAARWAAQLPADTAIDQARRRIVAAQRPAGTSDDLFGRDTQIAAVSRLLADGERLIVLTGIAGVGKSRLALQIAARSETGVIRLNTAATADEVCSAIAEQIDLQLQPHGTAIAQICARLATADQLLILDNVEQIAGIEELLHQLLSGTHRLQLLVTSRRQLPLQQALTLPIEPLPTALSGDDWRDNPALQLLLSRAGRPAADSSERAELQQLLVLCGGLPLALELTARLIAVQPYAAVIARIHDGLQHLQADDPALNLRSILSSSWQQLPAAIDRRVLSALGVFRGPFTISRVYDVCAPFSDAAGVNAGLRFAVDYALLQLDADGRFRRHPLLQQLFAGELAELPQLAAVVHEAHARSYLEQITRDGPAVLNRVTIDWCHAHADDAEDLFSALQTALLLQLDELLIPSLLPLVLYAGMRRLTQRLQGLLDQALQDVSRQTRPQLRDRLMIVRMQQLMFGSSFQPLEPLLAELLNDDGTPLRTAQHHALRLAADRAADQGDLTGARQLIDRALDAGPPDISLQMTIARWHRRRGEFAAAQALLYSVLTVFRREHNQRNELAVLNELALMQIMQGNVAGGIGPLQEAIAVARELDDHHALMTLLTNLATARVEYSGDRAQALTEFEESAALARRDGAAHNLRFTVAAQGNLHYRSGEYQRAEPMLRETLLTDCREGFMPWTVEQLIGYVDTLHRLGRPADFTALTAALQSLPTDNTDLMAQRDALLAELPPFTPLNAPITPAALQALIEMNDDLLTHNRP
jgi:tetratricopeptide (TPR) repeat protein